MRVTSFEALTIFLAFSTIFPCNAERRRVTPKDLIDLRRVTDPQISPDGHRVAFLVTEPGNTDHPAQPLESRIWVVLTDGQEAAHPFDGAFERASEPRWSPDGRFLAWLSNSSSGRQIYLAPANGGEAKPLIEVPGGVVDFEWSPNGKMIAFTKTDPPNDEELRNRARGDDAIWIDHNYRFTRLWVIDLADRKASVVTKQPIQVATFAWSPDNNSFALTVAPTPFRDDVIWHSSLVLVSRSSGEVIRTITRKISRFGTAPRWSPDGRLIAFSEAVFSKGDNGLTGIGVRLGLASADGGTVRYLLVNYPGTIWSVHLALDSKHLIGESLEGTKSWLIRIDTETENVSKMAGFVGGQIGPLPDFSISADTLHIAYLAQELQVPYEVWTLGPTKPPIRLTNLNPQLTSLRFGPTKEITWKNKKDHQLLYGVLITPPDYTATHAYPTIVTPHGGPQLAWWTGWHGDWYDWGQLLASNGFVVFMPNPRGSTGQGSAFMSTPDYGGMDYQDIIDGVDQLVELHLADPEHLGIGGWSYGGMETEWAITHTNRFKAAVASAGISDLVSWSGTTNTTSWLLTLFGSPFTHRAIYADHSAITFLQSCKTPLLLFQGQADDIVPVDQSWEIYNGLKSLRLPVELVIYPRETHPINERAHQLDLLTRVLNWYLRYVPQ